MKITAPCPFCGTPPRVEDGEHEENMVVVQLGSWEWVVVCLMCDARGPICDTRDEAIRDWNKSQR